MRNRIIHPLKLTFYILFHIIVFLSKLSLNKNKKYCSAKNFSYNSYTFFKNFQKEKNVSIYLLAKYYSKRNS